MGAIREIAVREIAVSHIGRRMIAIDTTGNAYDGILTDIRSMQWKYGKRPEEAVRTTLDIKSSDDSELSLSNLPLDFRVQVED